MDKVEELLVLIKMLDISHYFGGYLLIINDINYKQFIIDYLNNNNIEFKYTSLKNITISTRGCKII